MKALAPFILSSLSGSTRIGQVLSASPGAASGEAFQAALAKALGPASGSRPRPANAGRDLPSPFPVRPGVETLGAEAVALAGRLEGYKSMLPAMAQAQNTIAVLGAALQAGTSKAGRTQDRVAVRGETPQSASGEKNSLTAQGTQQTVLLHILKQALQDVRQALTAAGSGEGAGSSPLPQVEGLVQEIEARLAPQTAAMAARLQSSAGNPAALGQRVERVLARLDREIEAAGLEEEQKAGLKSLLEDLAKTLAGQAPAGSSDSALAAAEVLKDELETLAPSGSNAALAQAAEALVAVLGNSTGAGPDVAASSQSPWARFKTAVKSLGLPLSDVALPKENLPNLAAVLADSGFSAEKVDRIVAALAGGPASMDRVLAAVGAEPVRTKAEYTLPDSARPLLGRLLQEIGVEPAQVQAVLKELPADGKMRPGDLARLLARSGHDNLKVQDLKGADLSNVKAFLQELGLGASDLKTIDAELTARGGRMSMERFLSLLEAIGRPSAETGSGREEALGAMVKGMTLKHSLKPEPYFNRVATLIQAQREEPSDTAGLPGRSALQVLRSEASSLLTGSQGKTEGQAGRSDPLSAGGSEANARFAEAVSAQAAGEGRLEEALRLEVGGGRARPESAAAAVTRQVSEWLVYSAKNQMHHMRIQLQPPDLGEIRIYLSFRGGNLKVRFVAEHGFVKEALDQQAEHLRQTLAQQGLNLERFDVLTEAEQEGASGGSKNLSDRSAGRQFDEERAASPAPAAEGEQEAYLQDAFPGPSGRAAGQVDLLA